MKNQLFAIATSVLLFASCIPGEHNSAPNKGKNLDDSNIYGVRGGAPKQLDAEYPKDPAVDARANKIKEKFYSEKEQAKQVEMSVEETTTEEATEEKTEETTVEQEG